jgi:peroxiredoxin
MGEFTRLPSDLPVPTDDGAADHLPGAAMPAITLASTTGARVDLARLPNDGPTILYIYPMTGRPGVALPEGWDDVPGARGCTPESCGFRDHHADLLVAGASGVYGLCSQDTDYQQEAVQRLHLPFALLSDPELTLAAALRLPTFTVDGTTRYQRITLVVADGAIEHVFYPVFPPDEHAAQVLAWVRSRRPAS